MTGALMLLQFLIIVLGILVSFFSALYRGGGEIPREWRPQNKQVSGLVAICVYARVRVCMYV